MSINCAVLMDPIEAINIKKDSTFAMLLEAQKRGWAISIFSQADLLLKDGKVSATMHSLSVKDDPKQWFTIKETKKHLLSDFDVILMRKDPPFDIEYIYTTYLLELAEKEGVLVVNKPQSLRDFNEKLSTAWFPQCCPEVLVSRDAKALKTFLVKHGDVIYKPLEGMGGASVFKVQLGDPNTNVIIENLTENGQRFTMAQRYIPEISDGDKRILLIDGEPVPYALARIPASGESRGNLAAGATAKGVELSERDRWICQQLAPTLKAKGLLFVGIDVIGDYLTEINITSPTCIRELDALYGLNIAGDLLDCIEGKVAS